MGNLKVHLRHKLNTSDLRDDGKDFGAAPCIVDEWRISEASQMLKVMSRNDSKLTLRQSP